MRVMVIVKATSSRATARRGRAPARQAPALSKDPTFPATPGTDPRRGAFLPGCRDESKTTG